jgi:tetratricopeptide (TPR) repeat protein
MPQIVLSDYDKKQRHLFLIKYLGILKLALAELTIDNLEATLTCLSKLDCPKYSVPVAISALVEQVKAEVYRKQGSNQAAVSFTYALQMAPNNAWVYLRRGIIQLDQTSKALDDLNKAISLDDKLIYAYLVRSRLNLQQNEPEEALADIAKIFDLLGGHELESECKLKDSYQQVLENLDKAIAGLDDCPDLATDAQFNEKINYYQQVLRNRDAFPFFRGASYYYTEAYKVSGQAYYKLNDFNRAVAAFTEAISLEPCNALTLTQRGKARHELADYEGAIEDFNSALALNPHDFTVFEARSATMRKANQYGSTPIEPWPEKRADVKEVYKLLDPSLEEQEQLLYLYGHYPVSGMGIKNIKVIYNRNSIKMFKANLALLQDRKDVGAFAAKWEQSNNEILEQQQWRKTIHQGFLDRAKPYSHSAYPDVKLMPLWHGTSADAAASICKTGYANLAHTDTGFFGKGIYFTPEAKYAYKTYSKNGILLLAWVASYSAFPVIDGDMPKLTGKANYQNYDTHFVPVVPNTSQPNEKNFYPTKPKQRAIYHEAVVFQAAQCLARYWVELAPELDKNIIPDFTQMSKLYGLFKPANETIDLEKAKKYVYQQYLAKPYTLKQSTDREIDFTKVDWEFKYEDSIIHRPNHGLAHTLRCVYYVEQVTAYYVEHNAANLTKSLQTALKASLSEIQLRLLFEVVGRENEAAKHQDKVAWTRFFAKSEQYFKNQVANNNLKLRYYYNQRLSPHMQKIRRVAHVIDLPRCLNSQQLQERWEEVAGHVGAANCQKLQDLAYQCLVATGDRIIAVNINKPSRAYSPPLFVEASQNIKRCTDYIQEAIAKWKKDNGIRNDNPIALLA